MVGRMGGGALRETETGDELRLDAADQPRTAQVDRHPDSRIVRSALDEVKAIQTLLADVYKDAGDGRTLLRELVQNADDAGAERLIFAVLDRGWPEARNSLLRGSALLVANDGPFPARDRDALHRALGGSKADDAGKVGRFGVGLKSVFHTCEAIVYLGAERNVLRPGALNPWAGTGDGGDADPIHPDWDAVAADDLECLLRAANQLLGDFDDGLLVWVPLRRAEHLDRARDRQYGLGQVCPAPDEVAAWFGRRASLALLLAQCGHLRWIEADRAVDPEGLVGRAKLARVVRPDLGHDGWVGRPSDDPPTPDRPFGGRIEDGDRAWSALGIEAVGLDSLRKLRAAPDWPNDPHWREGRSVWVPRKALAHAAITVLRPASNLSPNVGARLRWAVFLPLDDDPNPQSGTVVEAVGRGSGENAWDIVLHGYFWPSHDRRSIPGVTNDDGGAGDNAVRTRWNRAVRDELLLPLLPGALANAVGGIPDDVARQFLEAVVASRTVTAHREAVTRRHALLPVITETGVRWVAHDTAGVPVLSIPAWTRAPSIVRRLFVTRVNEDSASGVFIDATAPRLGGQDGPWPPEKLNCLLECVPVDVLRTPSELPWVDVLVRHVIGPHVSAGDDRPIAVARWLAKRIGEGALAATAEGPVHEETRNAWRSLCASLPSDWLVDAPLTSQQAVAEIARLGLVGDGLLPLPLGRSPESARTSRPDPERLDRALLELGQLLAGGDGSPQRTHLSRLLLAETLLAVRDERPLGAVLSQLPLLRAHRLPEEKDEAWSVGQLRRETDRHRVFARRSVDERADSDAQEAPSDFRRAVKELAEAISENAWLVDGAVAATTHAPVPATSALAVAVLQTASLRSSPAQRVALLGRLAADATDATVRRAIRALLTGREPAAGEKLPLFCVRSQDSDKDANRKTLGILLRLLDRSWCAVAPELVEPLPYALVDDLHVRTVDPGVLHQLLGECLDESTDWSRLDDSDVLHLLVHLHGTKPDERARWRAMPLHRGTRGDRGSFDDRALRAAGELRLPPELESEIRLLDPDREVADLYLDVPELDDDGVLRAMLVSQRPQRFANQIVRALCVAGDGHVSLPRDARLVGLLQQSSWLPHRDTASGIAPRTLLVVPQELQPSITPLAAGSALGDYKLPEEVAPTVRGLTDGIVLELLGRPSRARQVQRLASALDPAKVARIGGGGYVLLPRPDRVTSSLLEDALQSPLAGSHPGWALVRAAANAVARGADKQLNDAVINVARALCAPLPTTCQVSTLATIAATRPPKESPSGRLFRSLLESFAETGSFFDEVLPHVELPTQDGQWQSARLVARSASGVARRHRVVSDLRSVLGLDNDDPVRAETATDVRIGAGTADALAKYFQPWTDRLPHGAVGAFIGILGNGKDDVLVRLAEGWLGDDVNVEGMRRDLVAAIGRDPCAAVRVFVSGHVAQGKRVEAVNLLGERVEMDAGSDDESVFATDPVRRNSLLGDFWEISFRDVEPKRRTANELIGLLGAAVEWWAVRVLRLDLQRVRSWWSRWGTGSQAQVGPVQASILAHLPLTLHQLDVRDSDPLREALRDAQRAQRRREQAPQDQIRDAMDTERAALDKLASLIRDVPEHQRFLWTRVQELMRRFGYREDSVLLELAQNADDALSQAAEIAGAPLPSAARRLVVRVKDQDGSLTVEVMHYGRPINDIGGAAFAPGRERQWDQDLYFMMLLNLSGKPGEVPGQTSAASTTGRFGLGFKSVHLVSASPAVVSGFVAFSIAGGLLPLEQPVPADPDLLPVEGHRATRVRLPLRTDGKPVELLASLFRRFAYTRALLPVFARQVREVVVDGGPFAGVNTFDAQPIDGATGWCLAEKTTELSGQGQWRMLRFRPTDNAPDAGTGTAALAVGLRDGKPSSFPSDLPFLWNVTPTSEGWGCGYAVNGPFKLDPGRTHVSLDDDATRRVVDLLGKAFGKGLVELNDTLVNSPEAASYLPVGDDVAHFLASLWTVLASGIDTPDELRRGLLLRLHGPGRGLSVWMASRSVVPSGLPGPFEARLPALKPGMRVLVAGGGLDKPQVCRAFLEIEEVAALAKTHPVVSNAVADRLRPLLDHPLQPLDASDLLRELAERWDHVLTPDRLHSLRPLAPDSVWKAIPGSTPWFSTFVARAADATPAPLRDLLLPKDIAWKVVDADVEDEMLRAAFAPSRMTLAAGYITRAEDLDLFLRLRIRHQVDARTMATWYGDLLETNRPAALTYLLRGKLHQEVLQWLVPADARPGWLYDYDDVRRQLEALNEDQWRAQALLAALFPHRFQDEPNSSRPPVLPEATKRTFFERLEEWWNEAAVRQASIESYEEAAWPDWLRREGIANGLRSDSQDHWLGLLVLGACRSLGRAEAGHHRAFLETAHQEGWWAVFKTPDDVAAWMNVLRSWQDRAAANLTYPRWMALFPAIYQVSRYLEKYRRLLTSAAKRPAELYRVTCLLAPRVDEALTGAGQHFDAPPAPLNMGLHWVLRELVRLDIIDGAHIYPDCWVPSDRVIRFLQPLGFEPPDSGSSNSEKARSIFDFLASELNTDTPHLHRAFDIPLRQIDSSAELRRRLGLED
jgi:hypothetical protein